VASIVENGATLQSGIGAIPNAVMEELKHLKNLGLHTEMWSDGVLDLIETGVIDNSQKKVHRGKSVSGFLMGSKRLYNFVHDNPSVIQLGIDYVNFPVTIARNPKVTAINSALEVDLTGQVCADSLGHKIFSGVGGQMDFLRGAHLSEGGKPIIALPSITKKGESRIVSTLKAGAGVVTTRGHVRFVVTEFGVADLYAKTLGERAKALIAIAHPDFRDKLLYEWKNNH
jgi:acyl-CoA hydrolase